MNEGWWLGSGNGNLEEGIYRIQGVLGDVGPCSEFAIEAGV